MSCETTVKCCSECEDSCNSRCGLSKMKEG
jgi:hypothetical protein